MDTEVQSRTASWINVAAGIWLIISPFVLSFGGSGKANDIWLGIVIGVLALIRAFTPSESAGLSWVNVIAGIWLIIAPFALAYTNTVSVWNDVVMGIVVGAIAIWNGSAGSIASSHRHAGA